MPMRRSFMFTLLFSLLALPSGVVGQEVTEAASRVAATPRPAEAIPTPQMADDTKLVLESLERAHYLNEPVSDERFHELVDSFVEFLDGQRLYFTSSDIDYFRENISPTIGKAMREKGDLRPAFKIFEVFRDRALERFEWVTRELEAGFDFTVDEVYAWDRSEAPWPATREEADEIWRRKLKFELIPELLGDKTPEEARETLQKRYERVANDDLIDVSASEIQEKFLTTLTKLYDPHSTFLSAETLEEFSIQMSLSLVGIGAVLSSEEGYCVIKELIPGGPAMLSKMLQPNDKIVAVAQEGEEPVDVVNMKLKKIVRLIRGEKGTDITLTVNPGDAADPSLTKEVTLVRDLVEINSSRAKAAIHEVPTANGSTESIGVIDVPSFYGPMDDPRDNANPPRGVTADVEELVNKLKAANVKGIVLDLRFNGGGLLSEAIDMTGLFIRKGPVVQVRDPSGSLVNKADGDPKVAYDGPLVVLTSRWSASASEIVAGALQNYGRAIIVGDSSTHGKGTVQAVREMRSYPSRRLFAGTGAELGTGAIKLTIQKFYLPNGSSTQNKGVIPDISLPAIEDFREIGESDLPNALPYDEIQPLAYVGHEFDAGFRDYLRDATQNRLETLEEFEFLQKRVDWLKEREAIKEYSLNLEKRREVREAEEAWREDMKARQNELAEQLNYPHRDVVLDAVEKEQTDFPTIEDLTAPADPDGFAPGEDEDDEDVAKFDIPLRESMRVLTDAIHVAVNSNWVERVPTIAATQPREEVTVPR